MFKKLVMLLAVISFASGALATTGKDVRDVKSREINKDAVRMSRELKEKMSAKEITELNEALSGTKLTVDSFLMIPTEQARKAILDLAKKHRENPHPNHETILNSIAAVLEEAPTRDTEEMNQGLTFVTQFRKINEKGIERDAKEDDKIAGQKARIAIVEFTKSFAGKEHKSVADAALDAVMKSMPELITEADQKAKRDQFLALCFGKGTALFK